MTSSSWRLNWVEPCHISAPIKPGLYSMENKASGTYVGLAPDEKSLACYPRNDLRKTGAKLV